jgi:hypothetical protein
MKSTVFRNMTSCTLVEAHRLSSETLINLYRYTRRHIPEYNVVRFKQTNVVLLHTVASTICTVAALFHRRHDVFCCQACHDAGLLACRIYGNIAVCVCAYPMQGLGLPGAAVGRGRCEECNPTPAPHPPPPPPPSLPLMTQPHDPRLKLGWHLRSHEAGCLLTRTR